MRIHIALLSLPSTLALAALAPGCAPEGGFARAYKMSSLAEGIGGPKALAQPGDFMLENDRLRVAILDARPSMGPHTSGASLIDADLARPDPRYSQGRGLDQLAEVFPTVNLNVTGAHGGLGTVEILADGSDGGSAIICTEGPEQSFITLLDPLWNIQWPGERPLFRIRTDYILEPGSPAVLMRTQAIFAEEAGCQEDVESIDADYSDDGLPLLQLALDKQEGGLVFGDFYLQGGSVDVFTPGWGFDEAGFVDELLQAEVNTFTDPLQAPFLAGTGDRVSYGLMPVEGEIFVPMFTSSQTVAVGAGVENQFEPDDPDAGQRFEPGQAFHYERYFAVGRGDVGSVVDALLEARGAPTGRVEGYVVDGSSGEPLSDVRVFAFPWDPDVGDYATQPYLEWTTDVGDDEQLDGSFGGRLPPGRYQLLVHELGRQDSRRTPVTVKKDQTVQVVLASPRPGWLDVQVRDQTELLVPSKISIFAVGDDIRNPDLGDGFIGGSPAYVVFTLDGTGSVELPPGRYYAVASRGIEYDLDVSPEFRIGPNQAVSLDLSVTRSVDTTGWVSADLHVHAERSHDSGVSLEQRVTTMAAEGVEFLASTDHDAMTDYAPIIMDLGVESWISSAVGLETTTLELGHFLGFPLVMDHLADAGGAMDWTGLTPQEMIDGLRQLGDTTGGRDPVVFVGHPRDGILGYFDQYGMDPYQVDGFGDIYLESSLLTQSNPLLNTSNFSTDFDAFEVLNGKRQEVIRTPTWPEMADIVDSDGDVPIYDVMTRTMDEQDALMDGTYTLGPDYEGVLDDWFHLLNLGYRFTALGNSDTHGTTSTESGCPRNYVQAITDDPAFLDEQSIAQAVKEGRVVASSGPFVRFWANQPKNGPGSDVSADGAVTLGIEVQTPGWFDVERVELYENGTLIQEWVSEADGGEVLQDATVNLATETEVQPDADSWYVLVALGPDDLGPVFTPVEIEPIFLEDVVTGALSGLGGVFESVLGSSIPIPRTFPVHPYAVTNPIWVDADADGEFVAPGPAPWMVPPDPLPDEEQGDTGL